MAWNIQQPVGQSWDQAGKTAYPWGRYNPNALQTFWDFQTGFTVWDVTLGGTSWDKQAVEIDEWEKL
jgi:hypothetical protein